MDVFNVLALLMSLAAPFSYINYRYFHLPQTIGVMIAGLTVSVGFMAVGWFGWDVAERAATVLKKIDFNRFLLHGVLSFLLFAGALQIDVDRLFRQKRSILALSTFAVLLSTGIVGIDLVCFLSPQYSRFIRLLPAIRCPYFALPTP